MKATYDPGYQVEVAEWIPWALTRGEYEALCHECGVTPMGDDQIIDNEYALRYADFDRATWLGMGREERVLFQLNTRRLHGMDGDNDEGDEDAWEGDEGDEDIMVCPRCHNEFPRKQRMMSAIGAVCPDCYDEASF